MNDTELDDIMEDLMVGHNFDYARGALLSWRDKAVVEARLDELSHFQGFEEWFDSKTHHIITVKDRIKELEKKR